LLGTGGREPQDLQNEQDNDAGAGILRSNHRFVCNAPG
jgi:hypothetical protein